MGCPEDGLSRLSEALALTEKSGVRWFEAELHRRRGELLRTAHPGAEAAFRRAIAIARRQDAKLWELRASICLARMWREQGKRIAARDLLAPVFGSFKEGFDTLDLKEAKALLDVLTS
jgi:predicted ATPase